MPPTPPNPTPSPSTKATPTPPTNPTPSSAANSTPNPVAKTIPNAASNTAPLPPSNSTALAPSNITPLAATNTTPTPAANVTPAPAPTSLPRPNGASAPNRLKRFRFKEAADMILLKAMNEVGGHMAEWGEREEWFNGYQKPTAKSLGNRLRRILSERRDQVKADEGSSGNLEEYGERETLLDDMLLEIKEKEEADRAALNEAQEQEKRLLEAGQEIRENALRRRTRDRTTPSPSPPRQGRAESDDETMNLLKEDMDSRRKNDATRLDLEQRRMVMEESRLEREEARFVETQDTTRRRLLLDEKKAEVEIEERKQAMQERAKMIDVLSALAQKLT